MDAVVRTYHAPPYSAAERTETTTTRKDVMGWDGMGDGKTRRDYPPAWENSQLSCQVLALNDNNLLPLHASLGCLPCLAYLARPAGMHDRGAGGGTGMPTGRDGWVVGGVPYSAGRAVCVCAASG